MPTGSLAIVEAWLDAVNRGDGDRLEQLTHAQIEIVGPRDSARAERHVLSEWLLRAGFSADARRWFCGADGRVVVEQDARWVDTANGLELGRARVTSRFLVADNRVASYARHDDGLAPALAAAKLTDADEVTARSS
jgi:hypothetical protein